MSTHTDAKSAGAIEQNIIKDQLNYSNAVHDTPVVRLDAEFYQADDIDGATEGLVGSGNLNYLVLQSQQTTDAGRLNNPFNVDLDHDIYGNGIFGGAAAAAGDANARGYGSFSADDAGTDLYGSNADAFSIGGFGNTGSDIPGMGGGGGAAAVAALKGPSINHGGDYFNDDSSYNNTDITNIDSPPIPPENPPEPPEDNPPEPPGPPNPPNPPEPPGPNPNPDPEPDDDVDLTVDIDTPIIDVDLDTILDPIEDIIGDIDIDIDAIIDNILPGDHGLLPDISASIDAVIGGTTLLGVDLGDLLDPLSPVINNVTNLLDGVIDGVENLLPDELVQPITHVINTVLDLTGLTGSGDGDTDLLINLGAIIPGFNTLDIGIDIPLNPLEVLLGDIDITVDAVGIVEDLGTHVFALIEDLGDGDLAGVLDTVIGGEGILQNVGGIIPELLVGLDVATDILPDFAGGLSTDDILGGVTDLLDDVLGGADGVLPLGDLLGGDLLDGDLLGSDVIGGVLDGLLGAGDGGGDGLPLVGDLLGDGLPGANIVGDIVDGLLGGGDGLPLVGDLLGGLLGGGQPAPGGDTDLTLNTGLEILGHELPDLNLHVPLDPVEALLGDIDIDVNLTALTDGTLVQDVLGELGEGDLAGAVDELTANLGVDAALDLLGGTVLNLDAGTDLVSDLLSGAAGAGELPVVGDLFGDFLGGVLGGGQPAPGGDTDLTLNTGLEILGHELPDLNLHVPLDPVEALLGDIDVDVNLTALTDGSLVQDALCELGAGDLGGAVGSITANLGVDATLDLLGGHPINLDAGTGIVSDILGGILGGDGGSGAGDTDLTLDTNIELLGIEIPDIDLDIGLDPVEALLGDMDIDIDLASLTQPESVTDILQDLTSGDIEGVIDDLGTSLGLDIDLDILGGDVIDTVIPDLGDIGGGLAGGLAGGLGEAVGGLLGHAPNPVTLPDPAGTITGGLGSVLDTTPVLGGLGGLFGGGGGGLFG